MMVFQYGVGCYLNNLLAPAAGSIETSGKNTGQQQVFSYDKSFRADIAPNAGKIYTVGNDSVPVKTIELKTTEKITYFDWLDDRNIALAGISDYGDNDTSCNQSTWR